MSDFAKFTSIVPAGPNWYRVKGSRDKPELEPVVLWGVLQTSDDSNMVVGVIADDIGVNGSQIDDYTLNIAGYIEMTGLHEKTYEWMVKQVQSVTHLIWEN